jgi:hypothetical protein
MFFPAAAMVSIHRRTNSRLALVARKNKMPVLKLASIMLPFCSVMAGPYRHHWLCLVESIGFVARNLQGGGAGPFRNAEFNLNGGGKT